jgi:glycosyltransferase involved in cell wall biosynthesis
MENGKTKVWFPLIRAGSGSDVFTHRLAAALERQGVAAEFSWFPLQYEPVPFLLRNVRPPAGTDIVFANSWNGFAFKRNGLPMVVTVHHGGFDSSLRLYRSPAQHLYHRLLIRRFEMRSLLSADAITAVSRFATTTLKQHDPVLSDVETIHNWVDLHRFRPLSVSRPREGKFRLLFVGKPTLLKGGDLLPKIMLMLGKNFELHIAGRCKPQQYADLPQNIRLLGWLDEEQLIGAYQECDALLFPSRSEGFGYAALEAMACGKPVIATNGTALPEVVSHGVTGILCAAGNASEFAAACARLAADPTLCLEMGKAARQRAIEEFSEPKIIAQYLDLIARLLRR